MNINTEVHDTVLDFISTHECIVSEREFKRTGNENIKFTTFGNRAGRRAIYDIIEVLDDVTKKRVLEMMKNKRIYGKN